MNALDTAKRWHEDRELVTDEWHTGRVYGYIGNAWDADVMISLTAGGTARVSVHQLRPLGLRPTQSTKETT